MLSNSKKGGVARSCRDGNLSASGSSCPSGSIKLQPRHFKKKEGAVWLNMFETISRNRCLKEDRRKTRHSTRRKVRGIEEAEERLEVSSNPIRPQKNLRASSLK